jgi:hypothetical protein
MQQQVRSLGGNSMKFRLPAASAFQSGTAAATPARLARVAVSSLALLFIAILATPTLQAQKLPEPADVAAAPVPAQIVAAKKVFIGNNASDHDVRIAKYIGGSDGIYNQFYADLKSGGKFELVSAPADADLVLEVSIGMSPLVVNYAGVRLAIVDPETNVLLWNLSEPVDPAFLAKTARKNIAASLQKLVNDLEFLALPK